MRWPADRPATCTWSFPSNGANRVGASRLHELSRVLDVPVSFSEAVLGTKVSVPTLEEPVTVKIPAGTESGKVFRVRGRGIPRPKGGRGDLLATVRVHVPKKISKEERALIEKLAELDGEAAAQRARAQA